MDRWKRQCVCMLACGWKEERQTRCESERLVRTSVRASEQTGGKESLIHKFQWYYTILALICAPTSHYGSSSPFRHKYVCMCMYACECVHVCVYGERACTHISLDTYIVCIQYHNWQTKSISFSHNFLLGYGCVLPIYSTFFYKNKIKTKIVTYTYNFNSVRYYYTNTLEL